jgi:GNAT superfamily N-acetyltransferase
MIKLKPIDPREYSKAIVELWNGRAARVFPLDERLFLQQYTMEKAPKLLLGAFDDKAGERLLGAALVKRAYKAGADGAIPAAGFLSFIAVAEASSRRGIGSKLLAEAEAWLAQSGARKLSFGHDSYHFFPGLPLDDSPSSKSLGAFLDAKGFKPESDLVEEDLIADLGELDMAVLAARAPLASGYGFRFYEKSLRGRVEAFFDAEFPGRWKSDTFEALDAGMRDKDLTLLIDEASGEVVGFSRVYDEQSPVLGPGVYWRGIMGPSPGGLGPIGVSRSVRGKGLGLALLRLCLEELKGRGLRSMVIDWTDLGAFYAKMGFGPWKAYRFCGKDIAAPGAL